MSQFARRDFLKLSSTLVGGAALSRILPAISTLTGQKTDRPNVLILVFDTMSAPHLSLYGYGRETTPNLSRFADRATVYYSHYSEGSFTTPGTASILTGLLPWHHRAINSNGLIRRDLADNNLFRTVGDEYFRIGFSQNLWADIFLRQFNTDLNLHLPASSFSYNNPLLLGDKALNDPLPYLAYDDFLVGGLKVDTPYSGSVTLGMMAAAIEHGLKLHPELKLEDKKKPPFNGYFYFQNRTVFQGIYETLMRVASSEQRPYLGYFHLWSPHEPYAPQDRFKALFQDDLKSPQKPKHHLVDIAVSRQELRRYMLAYDQYIANVDAEFGILMDLLMASGLLDNTYVVATSDHGQLFERGVHGHGSRLMYDEGIHIPLLISAPGQVRRVDVYEPTSNVDLFPTLSAIMGIQSSPVRLDGGLLPGFGGESNPERSIFSIQAKENSAFQSLRKGTFVLIKGTHKLILHTNYPGYEDSVELYDLKVDPYEMKDLSLVDSVTAKQMKDELLTARQAADQLNTKYSGQ